MNREDARLEFYLILEKGKLDFSKKSFIDKIYDDFEKDLKDIHNQVSRLKKQLVNNHHIECMCSFCKPQIACSYLENNELEEHIKNKMKELVDKSIIDDIDYVSGDGSKTNNYMFTNCDECKHKINGFFQEVCSNCKRFYGCHFEKKEM